MNHADDVGIRAEDIIQVHEVTAVYVRERRFASYDCGDTVQHIDGRVTEVIDDGHIVALLHQFHRRMRSYISGSTGDEYSCHKCSVFSVQFSE